MRPRPLHWLIATAIALLAALVYCLVGLRPAQPGPTVSLSEANRLLTARQVKAVTVLDDDSRLLLRTADKTLVVPYPSGSALSDAFVTSATRARLPIDVDQQSGKRMRLLLVQFVLPLLLLACVFAIIIIGSRGGSQVKELFAFSKMRTRAASRPVRREAFNNVAAVDEAVEELAEIRDYLQDPSRFADIGAVPPKGVLLYGPPGCGKTLLAKALAAEAGVPFFFLSGSEFVESLVGVGAARMRDLFSQALAAAPAIVFIDELDAAGRRRGAGVGGGHDEREQTLNELLVQMDGFAPSTGVVVIAATNRPDILDPALLRPGRFDRHIMLDTPDAAGRAAILQLHVRHKRTGTVDLDAIARVTPGFSGADLAGLVNEAALLAVRRRSGVIEQDDLVEGAERILHGPRRRASALSSAELRRVAVHEAGHAIVAFETDFPAQLQRISIVSRGRDLGRAATVATDRGLLTATELRAQLAITMAGCAAEHLVYGEHSTAGEADLEEATTLARNYVGRYGLSEQVGRIRVLAKDAEVFLGRDLLSAANASHTTMDSVDEAARSLIEEAEATAVRILTARRSTVDVLVDTLLERETLDEPELETLLAARKARTRR